ncbi:MAG: hypothetical protein HOB79_01260 [Rhodospirillaceae bacterium]|mgnify:CR=1|nr:hypothetical protein [Rhodospirillales bacterium]MBT3906969.1 hypothetical protein [Rhodospirillaceae bacterium]MBT4699676.1 hypothetical protein [Rhodospirillaceae bacterium]MBT5034431.1 hypothetical protein [Rhodospirillaceae bacterium]MBT6218397.1 hypothetical protein [Rhodospirillaceae bacterium]
MDIRADTFEGEPVQRLMDRDEVLQICYWYQGEGFGDTFAPDDVLPFLNCDVSDIRAAMDDLLQRGLLEHADKQKDRYSLSKIGKKDGGRLFADSFSEFQKGAHGECDAGCCDGDDHSQCAHD